ncbi:MAG: DUF512 domain-containing protein, partial [Firmicutes bacterium]|nr:DUF512 domain-containing protein [Bacillota bacterium]
CVFCFVDQIPGNMRKTLNMRDDDYRLSFLHGNFVTLTNLKPGELERMAALHMSPINISVHATNPELRERMLVNRRAGDILEQIAYLARHGIEMNTQVVLCPGWNDGLELDRTIADLAAFYPQVRTLSVVPVGLTRHRAGLSALRPCTEQEAADTVLQVERWQVRLREEVGANFVHAADEFYVLSGRDVPPADRYDEFAQVENGVGMIRTFLDDWTSLEREIPTAVKSLRRVAVVTGASAHGTIARAVAQLGAVRNLQVDLHVIANDFYGAQVTVTGLITGQDIVAQLSPSLAAQTVIIPDVMLKDEEDVFLDDWTVAQVSRDLGRPVAIVPPTARGLLYGVLGKLSQLPTRARYETALSPART